MNIFDNTLIDLLIKVIAVYLLVLWLLIPVWVYLDVKKRFKNNLLAVVFFIFILPFNIPGLIFYFVIRPELQEDYGDYNPWAFHESVTNIPIANFVSDKGIEMSLNLSINNAMMRSGKDIHMNVDLTHQNDPESLTIKKEVVEDKKPKKKSKNFFQSIKSRFKKTTSAVQDFIKVEDVEEEKKETDNNVKPTENIDSTKQTNNQSVESEKSSSAEKSEKQIDSVQSPENSDNQYSEKSQQV